MHDDRAVPANPPAIVQEFLEARGFGIEPTKAPGFLRSRRDVLSDLTEFSRYLCHAKFRRLLWWFTDRRRQGPFSEQTLSEKLSCTLETVQDYLSVLERAALAVQVDGQWGLDPAAAVDSVGPTLEWYVADTFIRKLHWSATRSICLQELDCNDYDVLAVRGSVLVAVECKVADPDHIEEADLNTFCKRHRFLGPDFSLYLVDSGKSVRGLADRLRSCLQPPGPTPTSPLEVRPLDSAEDVCWIEPYVYVANSQPKAADGIVRSLQQCLRDYHTRVRRLTVLG